MSPSQPNENGIKSIQEQIDNLFSETEQNPISSSQIVELRKCFRQATAKQKRLESPYPKTDVPVEFNVIWRWFNFKETVNAHLDLKKILTKVETNILMNILKSPHAKNVDLNMYDNKSTPPQATGYCFGRATILEKKLLFSWFLSV